MNRDFPAGEWAVPIELAREPDFSLGRFVVRPSSCELRLGETISVEPRVMQALVALAQRKGAVVSRDELVERCWNGRIVGDDAINRCIAKVRRLAELDGGGCFRIETIPRVGYRLLEVARPVETATVPADETQGSRTALVGPTPAPNRYLQAVLPAVLLLVVLVVLVVALFVPKGTSAILSPSRSVPVSVAGGPLAADLPAGAVFEDCANDCPQMVVIPAGFNVMGAAPGEIGAAQRAVPGFLDNEGPQHEVRIGRRFAMGRYDVTREEYAHFVTETNRPDSGSCWTDTAAGTLVESAGASWQHPGFQQTSRDPAVCISWYDAEAYTRWLSRKTGKAYRLPTEAEWEYAARADNAPPPSTNEPCRAFNGADADYQRVYPGDPLVDLSCHDGYAQTSPVGRFPPNAFGLFDVLGNVGQWMEDCYHRTYDGAPVDGAAWVNGNCSERVGRGGTWSASSRNLRIAARSPGTAAIHFDGVGFRVARAL